MPIPDPGFEDYKRKKERLLREAAEKAGTKEVDDLLSQFQIIGPEECEELEAHYRLGELDDTQS